MNLKFGWMFLLGGLLMATTGEAQKLRSLGGPRPASKRAASSSSLYNRGIPANQQDQNQPPKTVAGDAEGITTITYRGPQKGWGIITNGCPFYQPNGRHQGEAAAGTVCKYDGITKAEGVDMLVSKFRSTSGSWEGPFLVNCLAMATYEGDPDTLNPETVKDLSDYFTLTGKIAERRAAVRKEGYQKNPYYASAKQAQEAYAASVEKANRMVKEMDSLTGIRREKMQNQLRADKYEQAKLQRKANAEVASFRAWEKAHPEADASATDPQVKSLMAERLALHEKVKALVPAE